MEEFTAKRNNSNRSSNNFEERLKNRFKVEGSSLLGNKIEYSNLFESDNSISAFFSVIKIKFERATLREASSFKKYMEKIISEGNKNIIIDLNDCEFVDSSFFGVLVAGVKRLKKMDRKFYLVFDIQKNLPIFSATGLDRVFTVFSSVEEAIKH